MADRKYAEGDRYYRAQLVKVGGFDSRADATMHGTLKSAHEHAVAALNGILTGIDPREYTHADIEQVRDGYVTRQYRVRKRAA